METSTKLSMTFLLDTGDKINLTVDSPKSPITETEIKNAMDVVVAQNIFEPQVGASIVGSVSAKIVQTETTEYDLV